jgi:hypothetical protein
LRGLGGPASALFAAGVANAIDLEGVASGEVLVFASDFALNAFDVGGEEFDRTAALGADHVMVVAAVVLMLVARDAVVEGDFARQPAFSQQLQCAIYSGKADALVFLAYQPVEVVGREVVAGVEKRAQDGVTLPGVFQSDAAQVIVKNRLGFAHHLRRDRWLIVNPLLRQVLAASTLRAHK